MESRCHCEYVGIKDFVKDVQVFSVLCFYTDGNTGTGNRNIDSTAGLIELTGFFD